MVAPVHEIANEYVGLEWRLPTARLEEVQDIEKLTMDIPTDVDRRGHADHIGFFYKNLLQFYADTGESFFWDDVAFTDIIKLTLVAVRFKALRTHLQKFRVLTGCRMCFIDIFLS